MNLTQVKGNTYVLEGIELIPLYVLPEGGHCILLDTGLLEEREDIEAALEDANLVPAGILCSHSHVDHAGNNKYFQEKFRIPVALTAQEAGMCSSVLTLTCYFLTLPLGTVERDSGHLVHTPDVIIPAGDGPFPFAGAQFQIIHTPGHSSGQVAAVTPDNVCYAADALLSAEMLNAKLPYELNHQIAMESREKLRALDCDAYIMAHRGICGPREIGELVRANQVLVRRRAREVLEVIRRPMTASEINIAVTERYELFTSRPSRALRFQRNISFLVEYLVDSGLLELESRRGVVYYRPRGMR